MQDGIMDEATKQALKLLAYRRHFSFELKEKLIKKGHTQANAEAAVQECERLGYLNDEEDLKLFILREYKKCHGPLLIIAKLQAKKGWTKQAAALLAAHRSEQNEAIALFLQKNGRKYKQDKAKIFQALKRRGFDSEAIFSRLK